MLAPQPQPQPHAGAAAAAAAAGAAAAAAAKVQLKESKAGLSAMLAPQQPDENDNCRSGRELVDGVCMKAYSETLKAELCTPEGMRLLEQASPVELARARIECIDVGDIVRPPARISATAAIVASVEGEHDGRVATLMDMGSGNVLVDGQGQPLKVLVTGLEVVTFRGGITQLFRKRRPDLKRYPRTIVDDNGRRVPNPHYGCGPGRVLVAGECSLRLDADMIGHFCALDQWDPGILRRLLPAEEVDRLAEACAQRRADILAKETRDPRLRPLVDAVRTVIATSMSYMVPTGLIARIIRGAGYTVGSFAKEGGWLRFAGSTAWSGMKLAAKGIGMVGSATGAVLEYTVPTLVSSAASVAKWGHDTYLASWIYTDASFEQFCWYIAKILKHAYCTIMADDETLQKARYNSRAKVTHAYDAAFRSWVLKHSDEIESMISKTISTVGAAMAAGSAAASGGLTAAAGAAFMATGGSDWLASTGVQVTSKLGTAVLVHFANSSATTEALEDLFDQCDTLVGEYGGLTQGSMLEYLAVGAASAAGADGNAGMVYLMKEIGEAAANRHAASLTADGALGAHCRDVVRGLLQDNVLTRGYVVKAGSTPRYVYYAAGYVNAARLAGVIDGNLRGEKYDKEGPVPMQCNLFIDAWNKQNPVTETEGYYDPRTVGGDNDYVFVTAMEMARPPPPVYDESPSAVGMSPAVHDHEDRPWVTQTPAWA